MIAFRRLISALSVRARIIVIACIPVVGFLANGVSFTTGEVDVGRAFSSVEHAAAVADASHVFKEALASLRASARDFTLRPSKTLVADFAEARDHALKALTLVENSAAVDLRPEIAALRERVSVLNANFEGVVREQERLGFSDSDGIRRKLYDAAASVERIVNDDMDWLSKLDAKSLMITLVVMRRYETEHRLDRMELSKSQFLLEFQNFIRALDKIVAADIMKQQLAEQVKAYTDTFGEWIVSADKIRPLIALIDIDAKNMMPTADAIITSARHRATTAADALDASQARTRALIVIVGCAAILLGLGFSWWIGRSITRPLNGLALAMKRLAEGDTTARIPATSATDEIGDMARTVLVFRDRIVERQQLAATQEEANRARERRSESVAGMIHKFEKSVERALGKLRGTAERLESASTNLNTAADAVSTEARTAEDRVGAASTNVTTAAGSVEELAASINEIAHQAVKSTEVASRAVAEGRRTAGTMSELGAVATRVGEVVGLIQAIAGQTNLLALNATIEAARAGEAGRGFAVVASEVKSLAAQTARATEEIAAQIGSIQTATADAVEAIEQVNAIIEEMSTIASVVAATVEEQNAAVATIAEGVNRASHEARTGAEAMSRVAGSSDDARATAVDVKALADAVAVEAERLEAEVNRFLTNVQAA